MEGVNIMEAEKELRWKTTKEELPPNPTLDKLEELLEVLKLTKSAIGSNLESLKREVKEEK